MLKTLKLQKKRRKQTKKNYRGGNLQNLFDNAIKKLRPLKRLTMPESTHVDPDVLFEQFRDKVVGHSGYNRVVIEGIKFFSSEEGKNFLNFLSYLGKTDFKNNTELITALYEWYSSDKGIAIIAKFMKIYKYYSNPAQSFDWLVNALVIPAIRNNGSDQKTEAEGSLIHKDLEAQIKVTQDYRKKYLPFDLAMDADKKETKRHILTMLTYIARIVKHAEYKNVARLTREHYKRVQNTDDSIESTFAGLANTIKIAAPIFLSLVTKFTNDKFSSRAMQTRATGHGGFRKSRKRKLRSKSKSLRKQNISYKRQQRKKTM